MTNQEINEFLAERLFGLKKDKDWGQQSKHDFVWYTADELGDEEGAYKCLLCEKYFAKEVDEVCYTKQPLDYTANYQQVIEKIVKRETLVIFNVFYHSPSGEYFAEFDDVRAGGYRHKAKSKELGEAICRAAVEYLKAQEDK